MFENLEIFRLSRAMAEHAGLRQAVVARNMANADTPGFKAQNVPDFDAVVASSGQGTGGFDLRATRARHLNGAGSGTPVTPRDDPDAVANPNGNTVTLEQEMLRAVDVKKQHDRALAIYRSSLTLIRSSLGR